MSGEPPLPPIAWRTATVWLGLVVATAVLIAYVQHYSRVSAGLDIVQPPSADAVTAEMLHGRDVLVVPDEVVALLRAIAERSQLVCTSDAAETASEHMRVARAQLTLLYCDDPDDGDDTAKADRAHVTLVHPRTSATVSVVVRPTSQGGGIVMLPPHWRYAVEPGGCEVTERRLHGVVSWAVSRVARMATAPSVP